MVAIGLSPRHVYDRYKAQTPGEIPNYDDWFAQWSTNFPSPEVVNFHAVVDATFGRDHAIIDLTFGQLRVANAPFANTLPMGAVISCVGWPSIGFGPWQIHYEPTPHEGRVLASLQKTMGSYSNRGFEDDLAAMMDVALSVDLDDLRFVEIIATQQPEAFREAVTKLQRWSGADSIETHR